VLGACLASRRVQQVRALRLFLAAAPGVAVLATIFVLAEGVLPNLVIIAMGHVTGSIAGAVEHGLSSSDGHRLIAALAIAAVIYALSLLRGPLDDGLSAAVGARMQAVLQRRVIDAVSAPVGIAHLEDQEVLDKLESATGQLRGDQLADAPMTMLGLWGDRLGGAVSCAVVATFRWWAGLLLFAVWVLVRFPARAFVVTRVSTFRRATATLRHAVYLFGLPTRAAPAKEVRVFGLVDWALDRHRDQWHSAMDPSWSELRQNDRRILAVSLPVLGAYLAAGAALGHAAYTHEIDLRTLATMLPMLPMSMQLGSITMTDVSLESMLSGLPDLDALTAELHNDQQLGGEPVRGDAPARSIVFEDVRFRYPGAPQEDVLRGVDLELPAGKSLALVGVNGAGKSTLVSLLARLHDPTGGRITVDGMQLSALNAEAWRERIAIVYQEALWLPLTARENVAVEVLTGVAADEDALAQAAAQAGATEMIAALPAGWDTILSPQYAGGVDLSGGQWQRIALARALYAVARGARVLVLDEPTAQLDVRAEAAFYDRFLKLTEGTTSVVISHRFSTVRRADRIAVLDGGVITELGTHAELVAAGGTYAEMFRLQAEAFVS
jgi:ATP-binding cassette subfamily B protein